MSVRWDVVAVDPEKAALAQRLVDVSAQNGWNVRSLREASLSVMNDAEGWRRHFPKGSRDAIWFVSEVSDASMKAAFERVPAGGMTEVITERLAQNSELKRFVRRVMLFDLAHPIQALKRMQRTARVMVECLAPERRVSGCARVSALNVAYTLVVFVWLFDGGVSQSATGVVTRTLMRWLKF
jgi:hypothetical protein